MTKGDICDYVMFQTGNDVEDVGDFLPYLGGYVDEGYDLLVWAWDARHPSESSTAYPLLVSDMDEPATPEWTHKAIADWATWCVYRNGNGQKQQRGYAFRQAAEAVFARIRSEGGAHGLNADGTTNVVKHFINIPD